jgi:hypothetical protein
MPGNYRVLGHLCRTEPRNGPLIDRPELHLSHPTPGCGLVVLSNNSFQLCEILPPTRPSKVLIACSFLVRASNSTRPLRFLKLCKRCYLDLGLNPPNLASPQISSLIRTAERGENFVRRRQTFFRSDRSPVAKHLRWSSECSATTILELQSIAANAHSGGVLNPSAPRRRSIGSTKVAELTRCYPVPSLHCSGECEILTPSSNGAPEPPCRRPLR